MLRVASSIVFPGAIRAIASPRIRITNAFVSVAKPSPLLSGRRFSTKAYSVNDQIVKALENKIKVLQLIQLRPSPPADFPFKIQHSTYNGQVVLSREIDGEEIEIRLLETETHCGGDGSTTTDSDDDSYSDTDSDISSDSSEEENDYGSSAKSKSESESISIPLKVEHLKSDGILMKSMKFTATASADGIVMESLTCKKGDKVIASLLFEPEGEAQTFLREYLEKIGVEQCIGGFLCDYVTWKLKLPYNYRWTEESAAKYNERDIKTSQTLKQVLEDW